MLVFLSFCLFAWLYIELWHFKVVDNWVILKEKYVSELLTFIQMGPTCVANTPTQKEIFILSFTISIGQIHSIHPFKYVLGWLVWPWKKYSCHQTKREQKQDKQNEVFLLMFYKKRIWVLGSRNPENIFTQPRPFEGAWHDSEQANHGELDS